MTITKKTIDDSIDSAIRSLEKGEMDPDDVMRILRLNFGETDEKLKKLREAAKEWARNNQLPDKRKDNVFYELAVEGNLWLSIEEIEQEYGVDKKNSRNILKGAEKWRPANTSPVTYQVSTDNYAKLVKTTKVEEEPPKSVRKNKEHKPKKEPDKKIKVMTRESSSLPQNVGRSKIVYLIARELSNGNDTSRLKDIVAKIEIDDDAKSLFLDCIKQAQLLIKDQEKDYRREDAADFFRLLRNPYAIDHALWVLEMLEKEDTELTVGIAQAINQLIKTDMQYFKSSTGESYCWTKPKR